jgi:hypothetical protein
MLPRSICSLSPEFVKLPAHRAGLPGKEISFILCPLTPPTRRGLWGTYRSKNPCQIQPKVDPSRRNRKAKRFIFDPGIEVLRPARIACEVSSVHAMHDPTERALINGMIEMAWASNTEIEVDLEKVLIYKESRILCREFGMDPLGTIASGALLLAVPPSDLSPLQRAFRKNSIPLELIGRVKKGLARVLRVDRKARKEFEPLPRDEILKTCSSFLTPLPRRAGQVRFPSPSS